jgi:hypothetical protein
MTKTRPLSRLPALLALLALAAPVRAEQWTRLAGQCSGITGPRAVVIEDRARWQALWKEHMGEKESPAPEVDFAKEAVIAVFAGQQRTGGYSIDIELQKESASGLRALYRVRPPKPDGFRLMMITQPFVLLKVSRPSAGAVVLMRASSEGPAFAEGPREELRQLRVRLADIQKAASVPAGLFD